MEGDPEDERTGRAEGATLLLDSADPNVQRCASRSRAYALFVAGIEYPYPERWESLRAGRWDRDLRAALSAHPQSKLLTEIEWEGLAFSEADGETLQVEYTGLFDVGGPGGPPCPLYGGTYGGDRMRTMEEVVRFYRYFGLRPDEETREPPDHLAAELEFLHFLTYREAEAHLAGEDPTPLRRAQKDFLERHPGRWVPRMLARLEKQKSPRFYRSLLHALGRFLTAETVYLKEILESDAPSTP